MYEHSLNRRERLPNYNDADYILVNGKKVLNPEWEKARGERDKHYFRCPVCNQGIAFIIDDTQTVLFFHPKKNKDGIRKSGIISFEYFEDTMLPALFEYKDVNELLDVMSPMPEADFDDHLFSCYRCFKNDIRVQYKAEDLTYKYRNPIDKNCDYESICNICGDQIMQTIIPQKTKKEASELSRLQKSAEERIIILTKYICSNSDCNYIYF